MAKQVNGVLSNYALDAAQRQAEMAQTEQKIKDPQGARKNRKRPGGKNFTLYASEEDIQKLRAYAMSQQKTISDLFHELAQSLPDIGNKNVNQM